MPGGRPLKYTLEEITEISSEYFLVTPEDEWTITGVALALGTTRDLLCDYGHRDEFSDTIKKIKMMVENSYEKSLRKNGRSGDIFALKNFGWKDKQDVDMTVKRSKEALTDEELEEIAKNG